MEESEEERAERIGNELSKRFAAERVHAAFSRRRRLERPKKTTQPKKKKAAPKKRTYTYVPSKRYAETEALRKAIKCHAALARLNWDGSSYSEARAINERLGETVEDEPYGFPIEIFDLKEIYAKTGFWLGRPSFLSSKNHNV